MIFDRRVCRRSLRRLAAAFASGSLVLFWGCAGEGPLCYPVRGQVTLDGKPLAEAMVVLHPLTGSVVGGQKPIGFTDQDGRFVLTTYQSGDGAPPGEYAVTVEYRAMRTGRRRSRPRWTKHAARPFWPSRKLRVRIPGDGRRERTADDRGHPPLDVIVSYR